MSLDNIKSPLNAIPTPPVEQHWAWWEDSQICTSVSGKLQIHVSEPKKI